MQPTNSRKLPLPFLAAILFVISMLLVGNTLGYSVFFNQDSSSAPGGGTMTTEVWAAIDGTPPPPPPPPPDGP